METLNPFFEWLLKTSFQASLLIGLILLLQVLLRSRLSVRWRYSLWLILLIRLALPWAPQSSVSLFNLLPRDVGSLVAPFSAEPSANVDADRKSVRGNFTLSDIFDNTEDTAVISDSKSIPVSDKHTIPQELPESSIFAPLQWTRLLPLAWFAGAAILAVYVLATNFRLWRIVKVRRPLTEKKILDLLEDCKAQMGVQTILGIVQTDSIKSPALFGFIRPRLLLPEGLIESVNPAELRYIFLHELGHLRRYDILQGWLMAALQVLHWFNPLIWLAFHRIRTDRELVCDALAMGTMKSDEPPQYGRTIVNLLERFSRTQYLPSMAGILENKAHLKRRITMIAKFQKSTKKATVAAVILTLALGCLVLTNAQAKAQPKNNNPELLAGEFVDLLVSGKFTTATNNFDATMKTALPAKKLKEVWNATISQAGPFERQMGIRTEMLFSSVAVMVTCEFEKGPLDVKVVYDNKKKVSGLWFLPTPQDVLQRYQKPEIDLAIEANDFTIQPIYPYQEGVLYTATVTIRNLGNIDSPDFPVYFYCNDPDKRKPKTHSAGPIKPGKVWRERTMPFALKEGVNKIIVSIDPDNSVAESNEENNSASLIVVVKDGQIVKKTFCLVKTVNTPNSRPVFPIDFRITSSRFLEGDLIEIAELLGTANQIREGETYTIKGKYRLASHDAAMLHFYATNGETYCDQGPLVKRGKGEFSRTFTIVKEGGLHVSFYPAKGGSSFGGVYFAQTEKSKQQTRSSRPRVISTEPVALANDVSPSLKKITVTFDQEMMDGSWSWTGGGDTFPQRTGKIFYDRSKKTCTMPVKLEPGKVYWVGINSPSHKNFKTPNRVPAQRYVILFATTDKNGKPTSMPGEVFTGHTNSTGKPTSMPGEAFTGHTNSTGKPTPIPENYLARARQINSHTPVARAPAKKSLLDELQIKPLDTYIIAFKAVLPFAPRTPKELLDAFNKNLLWWGVSTHHFRTTMEGSELVGLICVDGQAGAKSVEKMLDRNDRLLFINSIKATPEKLRILYNVTNESPGRTESLKKVTDAEKRAAELLSSKAWRLWRERKLPQAEEMFQKAVDKDPTNSNAWNGLGWSQFNQGMQLNAKEAFEKCLEIEPKHAAALNGLGWIAKGQGKTDEAISHWEKAVKAVPTATAALSGLTQTYMELKQYDKAVKYYQMWLKVEPDNADAKAGLKKAKGKLKH